MKISVMTSRRPWFQASSKKRQTRRLFCSKTDSCSLDTGTFRWRGETRHYIRYLVGGASDSGGGGNDCVEERIAWQE